MFQDKCNFSGVRCRHEASNPPLEKCDLQRPCKFSEEGCLFEDDIGKLEMHQGLKHRCARGKSGMTQDHRIGKLSKKLVSQNANKHKMCFPLENLSKWFESFHFVLVCLFEQTTG